MVYNESEISKLITSFTVEGIKEADITDCLNECEQFGVNVKTALKRIMFNLFNNNFCDSLLELSNSKTSNVFKLIVSDNTISLDISHTNIYISVEDVNGLYKYKYNMFNFKDYTIVDLSEFRYDFSHKIFSITQHIYDILKKK